MSLPEHVVDAALDFIADVVVPVVGILMACAVFVAAVLVGVRYFAHAIDETQCAGFAVGADREVKFVDYSWFTWDCLTPSTDGKWIPTDGLREVTR
jgi:hypothetical protein